MGIEAICNRDIVFVTQDESIQQAAELMRNYHIGDVVVVDDAVARIPIGMVTDRDIVVGVVAKGIDPVHLKVGEVMSDRIITAREGDGEYETLQHMSRTGVRRVPVIDKEGSLVGILVMDDLLEHVADQLNELVAIASRQRNREAALRK